jgi:chromate transporter
MLLRAVPRPDYGFQPLAVARPKPDLDALPHASRIAYRLESPESFVSADPLGTVIGPAPNGWVGGLICVSAIYLPSFLLLVGVLPFWDALRRRTAIRSSLAGVNAAVVGLLLAALYTPVWTSAIFAPADFAIGIVAFLLLTLWAVPPWLVVILGAVAANVVAALV